MAATQCISYNHKHKKYRVIWSIKYYAKCKKVLILSCAYKTTTVTTTINIWLWATNGYSRKYGNFKLK